MDFDLDVSLFKFFKSQHDNQPIGTGCLKSVHGFEGNCFLACCLFLLLKCEKKNWTLDKGESENKLWECR